MQPHHARDPGDLDRRPGRQLEVHCPTAGSTCRTPSPAIDHFRRDPGLINPRSFAPLWPALLWLAACLFLGDVAVRRIALDVGPDPELAALNEWRKLRGQEVAAASEYMDKLKSRKAEVDEQLDRTARGARDRPAGGPSPLFPTRPRRGPIGEPLLEGGEPTRARPRGRPSAKPPAWPTHRQGAREGELHQPAAQGQAARLGRAGEGEASLTRPAATRAVRIGFRIVESNARSAELRIPEPGIRRMRTSPRKGSSSMAVTHAESMEARAEEFRTAYDRVKAEIAKVIVGHDEIVHGVLDLPVHRRSCPARGRARAWARRCWCAPWPTRSTWTSTASSSRPT